MTRQVIVVDTETTGLHKDAVILEVAAVNLTTGDEFHFVPYVSMEVFATAEPAALAINRYFERGLRRDMLSWADTSREYGGLANALRGNVLAGSNPTFDSRLLSKINLSRWPGDSSFLLGAPWHHRLLDLSAYAAGVLGLPLEELPGLHTVCEYLGVENDDPHSALADARATAECFRQLREIGKRHE
ncbi:hypothetical protein [Mycobacterium phage WXIN]|nr:hypothetical protein [Mycobacterium phage WXIN]